MLRSICLALACATTLAACASMTDIVPAGKDTYMLSASDFSGLSGPGALRTAELQRANAYCGSLGRHMKALSATGRGVAGWTPTDAALTFQCLADTDPEWNHSDAPNAQHIDATIRSCQNSDGSACTPTH